MKCFSLFSGIGGFDLALQNQGHEVIGACEIDKYARQIYSRHFPGAGLYEDATKIRAEELPDFDILPAGFPCQAFSIAGKRLGFEESRGTLFFEIARIAKQKRPRLLLLENVKGLLNHDKGRTFAFIIKTLDEVGYDIEWQVINSKYFVPQNRERIFIIGHLREKPTGKIFPLGEINGLANEVTEESKEQFVNCIDSNYWKGSDKHGQRTMVLEEQSLKQIGNVDKKGHNSIWGRVYDMDGLAPTINAEGGGLGAKTGLFKHGIRIRKLTPLECERLQGFPDGWTDGISDTQRYRCLGNAVTVPVVEFIIQKIRTVVESEK